MQIFYLDQDGDLLVNPDVSIPYCDSDMGVIDEDGCAYYDAEPIGWCLYPAEGDFDVDDECYSQSNTPEYDADGSCIESGLSIGDILIPDEFSIHNIYPNPFNPRANIVYAIPEYAQVKVTVYDIRGRVMEVLTNSFEPAGYYTIMWDASAFASGVYFVEMHSESFRQVRKVLHMK